MLCFRSHIRKFSNSQHDVRGDLLKVDPNYKGTCFRYSTQKSLSDTDLSKSCALSKRESLPNLFKKSKDSDNEGSSTGADEETSFSSEHSFNHRSSLSSISTECGIFEGIYVAGEMELGVAYNNSSSCLEITVGACRNLAHGNIKKKKSHPYVKLYVLPDKNSKLKTSVKKNTTDPVYNEVFKYKIERHLLFGKRLQASVWHSGSLTKKVFLGEVLIPLDGWRQENSSFQGLYWYPLCPKADNLNAGTGDYNGH